MSRVKGRSSCVMPAGAGAMRKMETGVLLTARAGEGGVDVAVGVGCRICDGMQILGHGHGDLNVTRLGVHGGLRKDEIAGQRAFRNLERGAGGPGEDDAGVDAGDAGAQAGAKIRSGQVKFAVWKCGLRLDGGDRRHRLRLTEQVRPDAGAPGAVLEERGSRKLDRFARPTGRNGGASDRLTVPSGQRLRRRA